MEVSGTQETVPPFDPHKTSSVKPGTKSEVNNCCVEKDLPYHFPTFTIYIYIGENNLQTKSHLHKNEQRHSAMWFCFNFPGLLGLDVFFCTQMSAND